MIEVGVNHVLQLLPMMKIMIDLLGYKVRIYTPFGKEWYSYFAKRLAERPANSLFILKNLFKK